MSYSPQLRTAVLLSGSGTGGAYHAGVLRALHEAGVKIDVMSGRGIGVVSALFAAIDAGAKTWEDGGVWRRRPAPRLYQWRRSLQWAGLLRLAAVAVLAVPLLVLATALVAYPLSFLVQMVNVDAGFRLSAAYADMVRYAFSPAGAADGDSTTGHAVPGDRVSRAGGRSGPPEAGHDRMDCRRTRAARAIAIVADGGRALSARRGARSPGFVIFARRCGISSADLSPRKSRRPPI